MTDEQRTYFAVEIDTFRLVALALLKQFTGHEGGIYIDFDSLKAIDSHIGKDITIPEGILLGQITAHVNQETGKIIKTDLNNDLIAVSCPHIAINILSQYKSAILSQEKMCYELAERLSNFVKKEKLRFFAIYKGLGEKQLLDDEAKKKGKSVIEELDKIERKIVDLRNGKIRELYDPLVCHYSRYREIGLNLGQFYTVEVVRNGLIGQDESKLGLFFFEKNNGNYVCTINGDLSWMKGKDLYHERVDNKLEGAEVDQIAMRLHNSC
ncbi:hypothetical protein [Wolbachia endosymbiont (group B) of Eupithecia inturbata]|uniref:hypothetical protein n=1 Tax=Wolbachia endosymbiont (group B) of Eupithecia inturbata TaxID=3139316 RepID=UPI003CCA84E6